MIYFEDLYEGYETTIGTWTLTANDIVEFAEQWDPQPHHTDASAAENSVFGGLVASSLHLFAICTRLFFDHEDQIQVLAMLGKDELRIPNPARAGCTLTYRTRCIEHRPSSSKADRGVVVLADEVIDENGLVVLTQKVSVLVARRSSSGL